MIFLDEHLDEHPKFVHLSAHAFTCWVRLLLYCRRNRTDGLVPIEEARRRVPVGRKPAAVLLELARPSPAWPSREPLLSLCRASAEPLPSPDAASLGALLKLSGAYAELHGYLDWNPSREQISQERARKSASGRRGGIASGEARAKHSASVKRSSDPDPDPDPIREDMSDKPTSSNPSSESEHREGGIDKVFERYLDGWRVNVARGAPPALTAKRRALIAARVKEHGVEVVSDAASGCWRDEYHREGDGKPWQWMKPELVFRDAQHVEKFSALMAPAKTAAPRHSHGLVWCPTNDVLGWLETASNPGLTHEQDMQVIWYKAAKREAQKKYDDIGPWRAEYVRNLIASANKTANGAP